MNISVLRRLGVAFVLLCATSIACAANVASAADSYEAASSSSVPDDDSDRQADAPQPRDEDTRIEIHHQAWRSRREKNDDHGNELVSIGHDSTLLAGQQADSVVSILGNTRVAGPVENEAVAVLGNTTVDSKIGGNAVAVLGNVDLGPHADVGGDVVAVLGSVRRDPQAIVHGRVHSILGDGAGGFDWPHTWFKHCLLYGRPLALVSGISWAWGLALGFLVLYTCLALLFRTEVSRCVNTFQTQPGHTFLAALLSMLLTPLVLTLLLVTVIGIAAVPFVVITMFCVGLFGKTVMLAWLGGRITGAATAGTVVHPALAVLIGGALVLVSYLVPVLGFLVFNLLGFLGFGAVIYTLVLATQANQGAKDNPGNRTGAAASDGMAPDRGATPNSAASSTSSSTAPADHAAPREVSASMPRAGFWIRMAALLLDVLLVGFVMSALGHVFHLHLLALAAYGAVMWKVRGSTIGGIIFDLRVVRLDGRPIEWETAIVRALGCFLSLAVAGLGFIWIAFDEASQAWHDKIAGTVVVRVPKTLPNS